jgi:hypothetical protein
MDELKLAIGVSIDAVLNAEGAEMTQGLKRAIVEGLINMLRAACRDTDRYHLLIGFMNQLRLEAENSDAGGNDPG